MPSRALRRLRFAGLGALVLLNVVLISLLLTRPTPAVSDHEAPSAASPAPAEVLEKTAPAPVSQASSDASEEQEEGLPSAERVLVNVDATTAWRATVGDCTTPGTLERTVDGGRTWDVLPLELAPVSRLRVLGAESLFAIGGGADCEPTYRSSSTAGSSWTTNDQYLDGSWYLLPDDRSVMAAPVGEIEAPCEAVDLAAFDAQNAAVLCADATLSVTEDGGATWAAVQPEIMPAAIGLAGEGYVLAGAGDSCEGVAVSGVETSGAPVEEPTCRDVEGSDDSELAVAAAGGALWLWVGEDVVVCPDGA